jgi:hypothetical protein
LISGGIGGDIRISFANIFVVFKMGSKKMTEVLIDKIIRSGAIKGGHAVIVDLLLASGDMLTIECAHENLPFLAMAINDAGVIAERQRKAEPGATISTEVPYRVTDVGSGRSFDDKNVLLRFPTVVGPPVIVAMNLDLARKTIGLLSNELDSIGSPRPPHLSS